MVGTLAATGVARSDWVRPCTETPTPSGAIIAATLSTYSGKRETASSPTPPAPWRSAYDVTGSVPGARPIPRSMRPGNAASSRLNCSATTSGAWLGSITPPEPTRMRLVAAASRPISTGGLVAATAGMLWCSATQ